MCLGIVKILIQSILVNKNKLNANYISHELFPGVPSSWKVIYSDFSPLTRTRFAPNIVYHELKGIGCENNSYS